MNNILQSLTTPQFAETIRGNRYALLDVRTAEEFEAGHLAGAINIDVYSPTFVMDVVHLLPAATQLAIYCRSGKRSKIAAQLLADNYSIVELDGGILDWEAHQLPVVTE
ncbi:MAG: rhodanese-like domain-containing protein [Bacteroidaceae bacterium]|nr:rhodanese-like domain-containing protein [Bacteroidaceae bacterium]